MTGRTGGWTMLPAAMAIVLSVGGASGGGLSAQASEDPGRWQQGVEYRIEARLNEAEQELEGFARVRYRNNSPRTLNEFYFHLYLNAFRPNSAWARKDLEYGNRTFQDLGPEEHGYERIGSIAIDGEMLRPFYPFAPDSTIVGIRLPEPLESGESVAIDVRWDARPSSVPRRQGRRGRQYDFAQWYPRVVVYDNEGWRTHPLYRAGEFYGEFATYDVTLELRRDQVTGATGVPVAGDPGWAGAAVPGTGPIDYQREWYGTLEGEACLVRGDEPICGRYPARNLQPEEYLGHLAETPPPGWKQVRWHAEDVHHFGWSTSPDYIYEQGEYEDVAIRVLYRPGDEESWGDGVAVSRTAVSLAWLDSIWGDYPYPQVTNLHRIEGGGTEFPMVIMDGSASQGLILHEVGHIYAHGILANNEWYEGWLDEGMTSFTTAWWSEVNGAGPAVWNGSRARVLRYDLQGISEPVVLQAEAYSEQSVYSAMIYTKGSVILWMLREMVGEDTMVEILRTFFDRYRFRHVRSPDFQAVAEEVSGRDLDWFFGQWLHTTGRVDYAMKDVETFDSPTGTWTRFDLSREGELRMPVPVRIRGYGGQVKDTVVHGMDLERRVEIWTDFRPRQVVLDPQGRTLDWNPVNGEWTRSPWDLHGVDAYFDNLLRGPRVALDHLPMGVTPLVWANDAGGWVAGVQARSSLLGYSEGLLRIGLPAIAAGEKGEDRSRTDWGSFYLRQRNPTGSAEAILGTTSEIFVGEGRGALLSTWASDRRDHPVSGRANSIRATFAVARVWDDRYLPRPRWETGNRTLAELGSGWTRGLGLGALDLLADLEQSFGFDSEGRRYIRTALRLDATTEVGDGWDLALRLFGGAAAGFDPGEDGEDFDLEFAPRERMFALGSGDPLQHLGNPFARSAGTGLTETLRTPGGGTLPGFNATLPFPALATGVAELAAPPWAPGVVSSLRVRPLAFAGGGWVHFPDLRPGDPADAADSGLRRWVASSGVGVEFGLAGSPVRLRVDLPFWVSDPSIAASARDEEFGPRVQFSFDAPAWN